MATKPLPKEWKYSGDINCSRKLKATSWIYLTCGNYFHFRAYLKYPGINYCFQINMGWNMHEMCRNGVQEGRPAKYRFTSRPLKQLG